MAFVQPYGTDASVAITANAGARFNAFTLNISQGITEAFGFGDTWINRHGTILGATGSVAGFTSYGTTADRPGISTALIRGGVPLTLTFKTGCTLTCANAIFTAIGLNNNFTGTPTSGYDWASDGALTETWVTT